MEEDGSTLKRLLLTLLKLDEKVVVLKRFMHLINMAVKTLIFGTRYQRCFHGNNHACYTPRVSCV